MMDSYNTHSRWLSEAISSGKRNLLANNSNGPLVDVSNKVRQSDDAGVATDHACIFIQDAGTREIPH